jgi:hypothetical protein
VTAGVTLHQRLDVVNTTVEKLQSELVCAQAASHLESAGRKMAENEITEAEARVLQLEATLSECRQVAIVLSGTPVKLKQLNGDSDIGNDGVVAQFLRPRLSGLLDASESSLLAISQIVPAVEKERSRLMQDLATASERKHILEESAAALRKSEHQARMASGILQEKNVELTRLLEETVSRESDIKAASDRAQRHAREMRLRQEMAEKNNREAMCTRDESTKLAEDRLEVLNKCERRAAERDSEHSRHIRELRKQLLDHEVCIASFRATQGDQTVREAAALTASEHSAKQLNVQLNVQLHTVTGLDRVLTLMQKRRAHANAIDIFHNCFYAIREHKRYRRAIVASNMQARKHRVAKALGAWQIVVLNQRRSAFELVSSKAERLEAALHTARSQLERMDNMQNEAFGARWRFSNPQYRV